MLRENDGRGVKGMGADAGPCVLTHRLIVDTRIGRLRKLLNHFAATMSLMCILIALPASGGTSQKEPQGLRKPTKSDFERRQAGRKQPGSVIAVKEGFFVASFINRLEWHRMPNGVVYDESLGQLKSGSVPVRIIDLFPEKVMWIERGGEILAAGSHLLICHRTFCGIVSFIGRTIYEFPVVQRSPDSVLGVVAINAEGTYAEVFLGGLIPGEDGGSPGAPREVFAWRYPDKLKRYPNPLTDSTGNGPSVDAHDLLIQGFRIREKQR